MAASTTVGIRFDRRRRSSSQFPTHDSLSLLQCLDKRLYTSEVPAQHVIRSTQTLRPLDQAQAPLLERGALLAERLGAACGLGAPLLVTCVLHGGPADRKMRLPPV